MPRAAGIATCEQPEIAAKQEAAAAAQLDAPGAAFDLLGKSGSQPEQASEHEPSPHTGEGGQPPVMAGVKGTRQFKAHGTRTPPHERAGGGAGASPAVSAGHSEDGYHDIQTEGDGDAAMSGDDTAPRQSNAQTGRRRPLISRSTSGSSSRRRIPRSIALSTGATLP